MEILKKFLCILISFSSGLVIAGAVFAFIAIIGIVPRLAQKTKTESKIKIYEEAIIFGGILGSLSILFTVHLPIGTFLAILYAFCIGIFFGCLAVSLAEILNVIPILTRRSHIKKGLKYFIVAIAIGKLIGSILYYVIPGFYSL